MTMRYRQIQHATKNNPQGLFSSERAKRENEIFTFLCREENKSIYFLLLSAESFGFSRRETLCGKRGREVSRRFYRGELSGRLIQSRYRFCLRGALPFRWG